MTNQLSSSSSSMHLGNKYLSHATVVVLAYFLHLIFLCDMCDEFAKTFSSIDIISL